MPQTIPAALSRLYLGEDRPKRSSDQDDEVRAMKAALKEMDPLNGAIGGPARVAMGLAEIRRADSHAHMVEGVSQVTAGGLSTVSGAIGLAGCMGAVATQAGRVSQVLGGWVVGGYLGAGASGLKGAIDLVKGIRHHDRSSLIGGSVKIATAALMLAGAVTSMPGLIAAGTAIYLGTAIAESHGSMTKSEMAAGAAITLGAALSNPILVLGGTAAYLAAAAIHNRKLFPALWHMIQKRLG